MSSDGPGPTRTQLLRELARQAQARGLLSPDEAASRGRGTPLSRWESEQRGRTRRRLGELWGRLGTRARLGLLAVLAFALGTQVAARPEVARVEALRTDAEQSRVALQARQGELALVRLEMNRLQEIMDFSRRYRIPSDLATMINDIALAEGVAPELAFRLVQVESGFNRRAVSPKGAVGYTQLMPATAFDLDPSLEYRDLFDRETNLRLGFRYLRWLIDRYDGDLRTALLAYNRGLGTVD
ncbi:MAG: transglycosylase SLT domain-containing protein, partial [Longimicrobiales bacterium]|nr:transglycosylase SLT domain-containing protein [Longimicrobiales bacterium]